MATRLLIGMLIPALLACDEARDQRAPTTSTARGDACEETAMAGCLRALTCNLTFTDERQCADIAVRRCCEDEGTCGETLDGREAAAWATCADDLEVQPCEEVPDGPPPSCAALPLEG